MGRERIVLLGWVAVWLIIMNSNEKRPLHPQELFRKLMAGDFREAECIDESTRLRQQREILVQLIVEYEEQITKVNMVVAEEEDLLRYRERLMVELETLRGQRGAIESRIHEQLETLRVKPVEMREQASLLAEMEVTRGRNNKLRLRIRDLREYIAKLEAQNRRLEDERRIIASSELQRRQAGENWRQQISLLQRENLSYQQQLRGRLRVKEDQALRSMQAQQLQIKERNRIRRESFKQEVSTPYHKLESRELPSDAQYFRRI